MQLAEILGLVAGFLTTIAFLPQVLLVWRTRKAEGVSLGMYIIFVSGVVLWLIYGLMVGSRPVVIANAVTFVLSGFVLVMKIRHG